MSIIEAIDINCQRGYYFLFNPVSFALDRGQSLLISGPNGIGKTTLLESIAGLRRFQQGSVNFDGKNILNCKDQWFDQSLYIGHKTGNKKELTCLENLLYFLQIQGVEINQEQAEQTLASVGLAGFEYHMAGRLSAGQKKRLALARLVVVDFPVWILDEPFVNLDVAGCDWLMSVLKKHLNNKGLLIITAHDNRAIRNQVSQELVLQANLQ